MIPRSGVAAVAAVLTLLLAGCSDADESAAEGSRDPGTSGSTSPADPPSPTETEPATTPEVAPAAGVALRIDGVRLRAPLAWTDVPRRLPLMQSAYLPYSQTYVSVFRFPNSGLYTLDELGDVSLEDKGWTPRARRLDDQVIDDQPVFHVAGPTRDGEHREDFGTILDDTRLTVTFAFAEGEPRAYRDEVIASVLETVDFGERSVSLPDPGSVPPPPARGPVVELPVARLRAPMYWDKTDLPLPTLDGAFPRGVLGTSITLSTSPRGDVADLDELGEASIRAPGWQSRATRLDDVVIDDQPAVHVAGEVNPGEHVEQFAMLVDGQRLAVTFTFVNDEPAALRDEVVASVVPTIRLAD